MEVATRAVTLVATEGTMDGHTGNTLGWITSGTTARSYFMNQHTCPSTDKTLADCRQLDEKQWQTIPAEKAEDGVEWHSR